MRNSGQRSRQLVSGEWRGERGEGRASSIPPSAFRLPPFRSSAFTLIELLVTITIIGIMAGMAFGRVPDGAAVRPAKPPPKPPSPSSTPSSCNATSPISPDGCRSLSPVGSTPAAPKRRKIAFTPFATSCEWKCRTAHRTSPMPHDHSSKSSDDSPAAGSVPTVSTTASPLCRRQPGARMARPSCSI